MDNIPGAHRYVTNRLLFRNKTFLFTAGSSWRAAPYTLLPPPPAASIVPLPSDMTLAPHYAFFCLALYHSLYIVNAGRCTNIATSAPSSTVFPGALHYRQPTYTVSYYTCCLPSMLRNSLTHYTLCHTAFNANNFLPPLHWISLLTLYLSSTLFFAILVCAKQRLLRPAARKLVLLLCSHGAMSLLAFYILLHSVCLTFPASIPASPEGWFWTRRFIHSCLPALGAFLLDSF